MKGLRAQRINYFILFLYLNLKVFSLPSTRKITKFHLAKSSGRMMGRKSMLMNSITV